MEVQRSTLMNIEASGRMNILLCLNGSISNNIVADRAIMSMIHHK